MGTDWDRFAFALRMCRWFSLTTREENPVMESIEKRGPTALFSALAASSTRAHSVGAWDARRACRYGLGLFSAV